MGLFDKLVSVFRKPGAGDPAVRLLLARLHERGATDSVYNPQQDQVRFGDQTIHPGNLRHRLALAPPAEHLGLVDQFIDSIAEAQSLDIDDFTTASAMLMPHVTQGGFQSIAMLNSSGNADIGQISAMPFVGDLTVRPVIDTPASYVSIMPDKIETWQVSAAEVAHIALENLQARRHGISFESLGDGLYSPYGIDMVAPALMLVPDTLAALELDGDPVILPASRDEVLIAGSTDSTGLTALAARIDTWVAGPPPYPGTPLLYRWDGENWQSFLPDDAALAQRISRAHRLFRAGLYAEQKEALERKFETDNTDIFVASCSLVQPQEGEPFTYCTWSKDVDSLLPETERVILGAGEGPGLMAEWAVVMRHAGHLMQRDEICLPPRWRVKAYPDAEVQAAMERDGAEQF